MQPAGAPALCLSNERTPERRAVCVKAPCVRVALEVDHPVKLTVHGVDRPQVGRFVTVAYALATEWQPIGATDGVVIRVRPERRATSMAQF